jgi:hypothetical protein
MKDILKTIASIILFLGVIVLVGKCEWEGYKQRFPQGGCLGFITQRK